MQEMKGKENTKDLEGLEAKSRHNSSKGGLNMSEE